MRIEYDKQADAVYVAFQGRKYVVRTREIEPGVYVDLDDRSRVIGFEILSVSKRYRPASFRRAKLENIAMAR